MTSFIGVPGSSVVQQAFRLGVGTNSKNHLDRICCYVNCMDLGNIGIRVLAVTCALQMPGSSDTDDLWELEPISEDQNSNSLFLYELGDSSSRLVTAAGVTLTFRLYLSGAVGNFVPERFDSSSPLYSLLNAVHSQNQNQRGDVGLILMGNKSPSHFAHKFILVARSPVFKALFHSDMAESRNGQVQMNGMDAETLNEFLHFIYTGTLTKPVTQKLAMVAEKYQVETLTSICRAASARETALKKGLLTFAASKKLRRCQDHRKQQT